LTEHLELIRHLAPFPRQHLVSFSGFVILRVGSPKIALLSVL
jgi:hypothetical protein